MNNDYLSFEHLKDSPSLDIKQYKDDDTVVINYSGRMGTMLYGTCYIGKNGSDNADAEFRLVIKQENQVSQGCDLRMCGPLERADLKDFLSEIIKYL